MKKSEAIRKLAEWYSEGNIGAHVFAVPNEDSMLFYIDKAKDILEFVEKEIGMVPPEYYDFEMVSAWEEE